MDYEIRKRKDGFIALISLVIISAIVLVVSLGVSLRSIDQTRSGMTNEFGMRALSSAERCAEEALMRLKNDLLYAGGESIIEGGETCEILPITGAGNTDRTVQTRSTISAHTKKISIVVSQVNPLLIIGSWNAVPDF